MPLSKPRDNGRYFLLSWVDFRADGSTLDPLDSSWHQAQRTRVRKERSPITRPGNLGRKYDARKYFDQVISHYYLPGQFWGIGVAGLELESQTPAVVVSPLIIDISPYLPHLIGDIQVTFRLPLSWRRKGRGRANIKTKRLE